MFKQLSNLNRWRETVGIFFPFARALWPALSTPLAQVISGAIAEALKVEEKCDEEKAEDAVPLGCKENSKSQNCSSFQNDPKVIRLSCFIF